MKIHQKLVESSEEIMEISKKIRLHSIIAIDTEFIRESTFFPQLEILQVATRDESWLVDLQAFRTSDKRKTQGGFDLEALAPLLDILQDPSIRKLLHAAQSDQECLYTGLGVVAVNTLDTAIAAGLSGYGDGIGLANLLSSTLGVKIKKGHARTNWSTRPLPDQQKEYAHADVIYLVELGEFLLEKLSSLDRKDWALEVSSEFENTDLYESHPEEIARKLAKSGRVDQKSFPVLIELVKWRESRVRSADIPRRWLADDGVLVDLANVRPRTMKHLLSFRGINKGELKKSGEEILRILSKTYENQKVPRVKRISSPSSAESQALDILKCYFGILAVQKQIAVRYLAHSKDCLPLLRGNPKTLEELSDGKYLNPRAVQLIGEDILKFLNGEVGLSVKNGEGVLLKVSK